MDMVFGIGLARLHARWNPEEGWGKNILRWRGWNQAYVPSGMCGYPKYHSFKKKKKKKRGRERK